MSEIAAMMGDPARANMLFTLKDSDCASAGDLTRAANVAPSTASEHLAKMVEARLIAVTRSGRNRYYRLATPRVVDVLEGLASLAGEVRPDGPVKLRADSATLHARGCCDHLAGRLGVGLAEALIGQGLLSHRDGALTVSDSGTDVFAELGVDMVSLANGPRRLITLCHDWSESAFHIGGAFGGALLQTFRARDWLRRVRGEAVVRITPKGAAAFRQRFGLDARATA